MVSLTEDAAVWVEDFIFSHAELIPSFRLLHVSKVFDLMFSHALETPLLMLSHALEDTDFIPSQADETVDFIPFHTVPETDLIPSHAEVSPLLMNSHPPDATLLIPSQTLEKKDLIPSHAAVKMFFTAFKKESHALRNPSQLSYINLNAPATGFTRNNRSPCQLFLMKSSTPEKIDLMPSHIPAKKSLIPVHRLIQNSRKPSHLFQRIANVATKATMAAITSPIGLASITAFKAPNTPVTALMALPTAGRIVSIVPTADTIFPITISTGPIAAAIAAILTMVSFVFGSIAFSLSIIFWIKDTTSRMTGISISPKEMASSCNWLFKMVSCPERLSCMTSAIC